MSQKAANINHQATSGKRCPQCGLVNFAGTKRCKRCKAELSLPPAEILNKRAARDSFPELGRSKIKPFWIIAVFLVVLLALGALYVGQKPQEAQEVVKETQETVKKAEVEQSGKPETEQEREDRARQNAQSREATAKVLEQLKQMQWATGSSLSYDEYNEMLVDLKAELDRTLPSFVGHDSGDENFRHEVDAGLREYTAARDWWKTTIQYSSVLTDTDRTEKLQMHWSAAQSHLDNAEKELLALTRN